jgi:hypothetical protein
MWTTERLSDIFLFVYLSICLLVYWLNFFASLLAGVLGPHEPCLPQAGSLCSVS